MKNKAVIILVLQYKAVIMLVLQNKAVIFLVLLYKAVIIPVLLYKAVIIPVLQYKAVIIPVLQYTRQSQFLSSSTKPMLSIVPLASPSPSGTDGKGKISLSKHLLISR